MNSIKTVFENWKATSNFDIAAKLFFLYCILVIDKLTYAPPLFVFPVVLGIIIVAFSSKSFLRSSWFWLVISLMYLLQLVYGYFVAANHHFVVIYCCWLLAIAAPDKSNVLVWNAKVLIALIMVLAVIQKFLSTAYMDGSFFALVGYEGKFFVYLNKITPFELVPNESFDLVKEEMKKIPSAETVIPLKEPWSNYVATMKWYAWLVLIGELLVGILLFTKWKHVKNITFLLVLVGILLTRQETGFLAVLTTLFIAQLNLEEKRIYLPFYLGFYVICITFVTSRLGFL